MTTLVRPRSLPLLQPSIPGKARPSSGASRPVLSPGATRAPARQAVRVRAGADEMSAASPLQFDAMASRSLLSKLPAHDNPELWRHFAHDADLGVRQAVASLGPASVWTVLADDPSPWVRQAVARRAAASPEHRVLANAQRHDLSLWVRLAGVEGLTGQAHGADLLQAYVSDPEPLVRASALQALPDSVPSAVFARLAVHDPIDWVRHVALRLLALRDPQAARQAFRELPAARQGTLVSVLHHFAPNLLQGPMAALMRCAFNKLLLPADQLPAQVLEDLLQHPHRLPNDALETKRDALVSKAVRAWSHPAQLQSDSPYQHALFFLRQPAHADAIGRKMRDANLPRLDGALPVIEMLRTSPNPFARSMATQLLTKLPNEPATLPMLQALLLDTDAKVRTSAAKALLAVCAQLPEPSACLSAARHLAASSEYHLREQGMMLLDGIATDETLPSLAEALRREKSHGARMEAVRALVAHPSLEALPMLNEVVNDPDPKVRARLAELLEKASLKRAYGLLAALADDVDTEVREVTTHTLCKHARSEDVVVSEEALRLLDTLDSVPNPVVSRLRSTVLPEALVAFQHKPAMRAMLHRWVERLDAVHVGVLQRLAKSAYPERERLLMLLMDSPHPAVADEARQAATERLNAALRA